MIVKRKTLVRRRRSWSGRCRDDERGSSGPNVMAKRNGDAAVDAAVVVPGHAILTGKRLLSGGAV
jgi:hypothetical protein